MFPKTSKILIVDDMSMFRTMIKEALNALEYRNYVEASDGNLALAALEKSFETADPFHLIICDWTMPKMKGIDLLRLIRGLSWGTTLPFIMLTAESEKDRIIEAINAGVSQYIVKPFTVEGLKRKMELCYLKSKNSQETIIIE